MIPCTAFVWFFSIISRSCIVPVVLYNVEKVSHSNTHIQSKNQNTKKIMETKNIPYFIFKLKNPRMLILWRRLILSVKMAAAFSSHLFVVIFVVA